MEGRSVFKRKKVFVYLFVFLLAVSPMLTVSDVAAKGGNQVKDVIIYQNVPEVNTEIDGKHLQLKALRVYKDGHFTRVTEGLVWKSTNPRVASVDKQGNVTFTGKKGKAVIHVKDRQFSDRITLAYHMIKKGKSKENGEIIKRKGKRYHIIEHAVKGLTLEEKVGQMLMPDFRTFNGQDVTTMLPEIEALVKRYHLGGVILFRENVVTTEQTARLVRDYQEASEKFGLLLTIDQEGGIVTRLQSGTDMPGNMAIGATRSEALAYDVGAVIGRELAALGINMNLAPVLDVNNNPDNPVIGVRSFGEQPALVADLGVQYAKGLQDNGIAATAKHFPGHGDTAVDSHLGLPEVPHDKERLKEVELYPFQRAIDAGIDAVMTAHVTFPKIDDTKVISKKDGTEITLPATLSYKVLTELMRKEMGFDGVIMTDALNMKAITDHFGPVEAVIRAVKAGTDIVLMPVGLQEVADGLLQAVESGEIAVKRIDESVQRILTLKVKRGILKEETPLPIEEQVETALQMVGSREHRQVEREVAARAVTLIKNDQVLPLSLNQSDHLVVVGNAYVDELADAIRAHHQNMTVIKASAPLSGEALQRVKTADAVVVGSYTFNVAGRLPSHPQMQLVNQIVQETEHPVVAVGIRNPYDVMAFPAVDAYMAQYGFRTASFKGTADVLFGVLKPTGRLPVTIPTFDGGVLYPYGHGLRE